MSIHTALSNRESGVTHMLHGCPGYHWTPAHRGGAPPRCAQCCICVWCRGSHCALHTGLSPSPRSGDAGTLSLTPGSPSAQARQRRAKEESNPASWSLSLSCAAQEESRGEEAGEETACNYATHSVSLSVPLLLFQMYIYLFTHYTYSLLALFFLSCSPFFLLLSLSLPPPT